MTPRPAIPYQALAAAFTALIDARARKAEADRKEDEARRAFDALVTTSVGPGRKLILDLGDKREGDDPAARVSGCFVIVTHAVLPSGEQVQAELVRK